MNKREYIVKSIINKIAIFIVMLCSTVAATAQTVDYTGIWNGKFYDNSALGNPDDTYRFEVQIAQTGKGLEGVTYSYQSTRFYGKASHNGFIKTDGKKIVVQETRMIEIKMDLGVACLMTCHMTYSKVGDDEYLEGNYSAIEENGSRKCPGGYVKLKKIKKSIFGTDPKVQLKLNALAKKKKTTSTAKTTTPAAPKPAPAAIVKKAASPSVPAKPKNPTRPTPPAIKPDVAVTTPNTQNPTKNTTTTRTRPNTTNTTVTTRPTTPTVTKPKDTQVVAVVTKPKDTPIAISPTPVVTVPIKTLPPVPPVLAQRKTELAQTINVSDSGDLVLNFYDYGEVDGDVVTIYVNNVAVVTKAPLRASAIEVPIKLSPTNPKVEVIMYADNLGTIPPNTAYMTVKVNGKRFEATIESTEQKNASILFVYQPVKKKN